MGDESAATLLRNLPDRDLQRITDEVANLGQVPFEVTLEVLEEYQQMMSGQDFMAVGGQEVAIAPADQGIRRERRQGDGAAAGAGGGGERGVVRLKKVDPQQLARFLVGEHSADQGDGAWASGFQAASALLMSLEPEVRADCVRRLASLGQYSPEVAAKVSSVLNRRLRSVGDQSKQAESGFPMWRS